MQDTANTPTSSITTITVVGEMHEVRAIACPISAFAEFNDGTDLQLFCDGFEVSTDLDCVPDLVALWETR